MRIVAGEFRGRRLSAPAGRETRPTADRVREAVFSLIGAVEGMAVLDLFAGSGALGLEALSRGAASATFVDRSPRAVASLRANVGALGVEDRARVVARDWRAAVAADRAAGRTYDLIILDPPYTLLGRIAGRLGPALEPLVPAGGTLVLEGAARAPLPTELSPLHPTSRIDRTYGDTAVSVLRLG
jgi:16S rRNA (guanine966-N2)-methyltransferase